MTNGLYLGTCLDSNGEPLETAVVPPSVQPLHMGVFGATGGGKSLLVLAGSLANQRATDGANILFTQKEGNFGREYLQSHYVCNGTLSDTYYIDVEEVMPPTRFFDIEPLITHGVSRSVAIQRVCDQYVSIARRVVGDSFDASTRAEAVIRAFVKALFDDANTFQHADLRAVVREFSEDGTVPDVADPALAQTLADHAAMPPDTRDHVSDAIAFRMSEIAECPQLRAALNQSSTPADADAPTLTFSSLLNESVTLIFDLGGLGADRRHAVAVLLLSQLWRALKQRLQSPGADNPVVNVYVEEAAAFRDLAFLSDLLTQGRQFDVSLTLIAQSPNQLITDDAEIDIGTSLLENAGTIVSGRLPMASPLADRFSNQTLDRQQAVDALSSLERGQWLLERSAEWGETRPPISVLAPPSPPPGHPASEYPLAESRLQSAFETAFADRREAVKTAGTVLTDNGPPSPPDDHRETPPSVHAFQRRNLLPQTTRLPDSVGYNIDQHHLSCEACGVQYSPTQAGLKRAVQCCQPQASNNRDDVPVIECYPQTTMEALRAAGLTVTQGLFLQVVHQATHQRLPPEAYSICRDSMVRLREYAGIDKAAVDSLLEDGYLTIDTRDTPHRIYSVTDAGRSAVNITNRSGRDYGDYVGDLGESALHRLMVIAGCRYLEQRFVTNDASPAVAVNAYHPVGESRLDAAAVTADGSVVATVEAESDTNDHKTAVPADYDTMADCSVDAAIWVVPQRRTGHSVLAALNEPAAGDPRVSKTYSDSTPLYQFQLDTPGCTEIISITRLLKEIDTCDQAASRYLRNGETT